MKLPALLTYLLLTICTLSSAFAADPLLADANIHINADTMKHGDADGIYNASGAVIITWQGLRLTAEQAEYDSINHKLHASGKVLLSKGRDVLTGENLILDMDSGQAEMDRASLLNADTNLHVTGEKIIRVSERDYEVRTTELTSCPLPDPSWKFTADKLNVNVLGYATGRNVIFYIRNVPVLYLPWIAFPVVLEKRSGLLFPRVGYSKTRGAQLDLPLYWVISPSQDLQFDLDLLSRRGIGTALDYRYIRRRGSEGHLSGYQIYDFVQNRWRWQVAQDHKEIFSQDLNLRTEINRTGDRAFLGDYGEKSGEYNRQSSDTTLNILKTWPHYALTTYLRYSEDLYAADNRATLQTLPSVGLAGVRQRLPRLPLYLDIDASVTHFDRETGPSGGRLQLFPRLTLLVPQNPYLQASAFAGAHVRGYATDKRSGTQQPRDGDLLPEVGARVSSSLTRVYQLQGGALQKLRHEIVPEISYSYLPERDQQRLPLYDYGDRLLWQNMVTLSATSLVNGKFKSGDSSEYRDLSRVKLLLGYSFEGPRRDLLTLADTHRPWSDLILESDSWLNRAVRVTFDSRFNLYEHRFSSLAAGVEADDRRGNSIATSYRMAHNEVEYFEARLATKLVKPFNLGYTARYSFDRGDFLESVYSAEYRHQCWSVTMALHQRTGNFAYTVNFNLAGLTGK